MKELKMKSKVNYTSTSQDIYIDGKKVQILSGAMHYFRIHPKQWQERLEKLVQCGLNCVETYMCWNLHEPKKGEFDFSGILDFEKFIKIAQDLGLYVIVRPGPFICAEFDNGGFPGWLMAEKDLKWRRYNETYLRHVKDYFSVILPKLKALDYDNNGPVIALQIENEYGSYCHDKDYIKYLKELYLSYDITIPLFTADGAYPFHLSSGILDEETPCCLTYGCRVDGSHSVEALANLRSLKRNDPFFCMELWAGWFESWGGDAYVNSNNYVADEIDFIIKNNGNFNIYMFNGGTNFGFTAGANGSHGNNYAPDVTSYDYTAPLDEAGNATGKYFAIQDVIKKNFPNVKTATPKVNVAKSFGSIELVESALLFDNLDNVAANKVQTLSPLTMEEMCENSGFILYRTRIDEAQEDPLQLHNINDRVQIFADNKLFQTYYRNEEIKTSETLKVTEAGVQLDILVESFGHINYGPQVGLDFKGINGDLIFGNQARLNYTQWSLPLNDLSKVQFKKFVKHENMPAFYRGYFEVDSIADTYIEFPGVCGVIFINGFNLGRYWNVGPSKNLFVPAPVLKEGTNEIIIFETENLINNYVNSVKNR